MDHEQAKEAYSNYQPLTRYSWREKSSKFVFVL